MLAFTILGFLAEGGRYLDFTLDLFAESPVEAREKAQCQYANLVVSDVVRAPDRRLDRQSAW